MRWFIAVRYFLSHKRQSLVCIMGVTISVTMYIAMTAMMNGFKDKFIIETVESTGHITIHDEPRETRTQILERVYNGPNDLLDVAGIKPRDQVKKIKNSTALVQKLRRMPGILAAAPEVSDGVIATYGTRTMDLTIVGIEPEQELRVTTIGTDLVSGDFRRLRTTANGVILGHGVADTLGAKLDDEISLSSATGGRSISRVVGIFDTGVTPVDYTRGYMLLNDAQTLLDRKNVINEIVLRTDDYNKAPQYAAQIESVIGYKTEAWQESNANFLNIFNVQTIITDVVTLSLLVVAAFGVLNILIMAVLERVNDISILKSFGYSRRDITLIYLFQGLMIGLIGAGTGEIFGKLAVEGLRRIPVHMQGLVTVQGLLMSESPKLYLSAFFIAIVVVLIAAVYPARRAARYDPVEVIRGAH